MRISAVERCPWYPEGCVVCDPSWRLGPYVEVVRRPVVCIGKDFTADGHVYRTTTSAHGSHAPAASEPELQQGGE